jgi:hypothetical protein
MVNKFIKAIYIIFCLAGIIYLAVPNYDFPKPPPDALQSQEPADTESPMRRSYFTDYTREQILEWYKSQFEVRTVVGIKIPAYLLNYPPEDAASIIRDQTRSTFLQEVVHPFRESIYINGFQAKSENDTILINNKVWLFKITIKYVPSNVWIREGLFLLAVAGTAVLYNLIIKIFKSAK